jgi:hypothetical protein
LFGMRLRAVLCSVLVLGSLSAAQSPAGAEPQPSPPALADAQSAADEASASAIAAAFGHAVTIDAYTSETQLVQALPDGAQVSTQNEQPVRVHRDESWVTADSTLEATATGLQPAAAVVPVVFSAGGSSTLAKVQAPDGSWLTESWQHGVLPAPAVDGSSATYPNVYPGVDLQLSATATGMSQVLVVKDAAAAANPQLSSVGIGIDNGTLSAAAEAGGSTVMKNASGQVQLTSATATWWDSSSPGASAAGPGGLGVPAPVPATVTDTQMTVDAAAVANTADVTYPVFVDPSLTGYNVGWTYVDKTHPTTSYWKDTGNVDTAQHVGYVDGAHSDDHVDHTTRAFWQMDTSGWKNTHIQSASFDVTNVYSYSCSPRQVDLFTSGAVTSATTWDTQPSHTTPAVDTQTVAFGYSSSCPASTNNVGFDATSAVQRAAAAGYSTINLELVAHDESDPFGWKKFGGQAKLVTVYYTIPQAQALSVSGKCWAVCRGANPLFNTNLPTYAVTPKQADGSNVQLTWQVCAGTPSSTGGCKNSFRSLSVPANSVAQQVEPPDQPLGTNPWVVRVTPCRADHTDICGATTNWIPFRVDTVAPPSPAASSTGVDLTGVNVKGTAWQQYQLNFSGSDADSAVWGYGYSFTASATLTLSTATCPRPSNSTTYIVCANAGPVAFTPGTGTTVLTVWAIDQAGNVSTPAKTYHFTVATPSGAAHSWRFAPSDFSNNSTTVADSVGTGNEKYDLALHATSWFTVGQDYDGSPLTDPNVDPNLPSGHFAALSFSANAGSGQAYAATSGMVNGAPPLTIDATTGGGLTVAAWVKATASTVNEVFLSQDDSTSPSVFTLGEDASGHWQFCMRTTTSATGAPDCVKTTSTADTDGRWTYVVGSWNPGSGSPGAMYVDSYRYALASDNDPDLGVIGAGPLDSGTAAHLSNPVRCEVATGVPHIATAASQGAVVVGRGYASGQASNWWTSAVADPAVWNNFEDPTTRAALWGGGSCS